MHQKMQARGLVGSPPSGRPASFFLARVALERYTDVHQIDVRVAGVVRREPFATVCNSCIFDDAGRNRVHIWESLLPRGNVCTILSTD